MINDLVGTSIGQIRLVELLGSGGMGEVYRGFDTRLQRHVAVKTIRAEHRPDAEMKARFLREARLLSQLDHPAICKVYDLVEGDDADYLIFELVAGVTLRRRLKDGGLHRREALQLGAKIAQGLAAAHRERIVHRDLKPENVMVTPDGGVKILDFGISTALHEPVTHATLAHLQKVAVTRAYMGEPETVAVQDVHTGPTVPLDTPATAVTAATQPATEPPTKPLDAPETSSNTPTRPPDEDLRRELGDQITQQGLVIGTLQYMSPEQARGEPVTTSGDLYSFGIMMQELLTGRRAYDRYEPYQLLTQVAAGESRPMVDEDPAVVALIEDLKRRNPEHRPTAEQTVGRIREILDAPARRRRRRLQRIAVSAAFAVLLAVLAVVFSLYQRASREAERANREAERANQAATVAEAERDRANREKSQAESIAAFLADLFGSASPDQTQGEEISARELLYRGADGLEQNIIQDPLLLAGLQELLGGIILRMGNYPKARSLLSSSLELRREHLGAHHPATAQSRRSLAVLHRELREYDSALELLLEARKDLEAGSDRESGPALGSVLHELATLHHELGRLEEAEELYRQTLDLHREHLGENSREVADTLHNYAILAWQRGDLAMARERFERLLPVYESLLGDRHPDMAGLLNNLGLLYRDEGLYDQAESSFRRALGISRDVLGEEHRQVAATQFSWARLHLLRDEPEAAHGRFEAAWQIRRSALGFDHYDTGHALLWLGETARRLGRLEEAAEYAREGKAIMERGAGADHPRRSEVTLVEAELARDQGKPERADALFRLAEAQAEEDFGVDHAQVEAVRQARNRRP